MAIVTKPKGSAAADGEETVETRPPPDGGWGWVVVFGSFMVHIVTDGVTYSFGVFYEEFSTYFNEKKGATAWILSLLVGITLCSGPISSSFVNRWGCRVVTIAGSILAAVCVFASAWAQNIVTLYFTIGIGTGLGFGLIYLPAIVSVTTYFEKKRSLATGIAVCGSGFGTFIFAPIITWLLEEYGWRGALIILSAIVLKCILFGALFRPLEEPRAEKKSSVQIVLRKAEAQEDMHVSNHELPTVMMLNGDGKMQRPHSMGHFSIPRGIKFEQNGNIPHEESEKTSEISRLALSHPMLITSTQSETRNRYYGSQNLRRPGPLYKPDIFYQGSLMNIPSYRSRLDLKRSEDAELMERPNSSMSYRRRRSSGVDTGICGVLPCSDDTKDTLKEMLDFSLFKDVIFIVFTLSNFLTSIGFNVPYVYIVSKATDLNLTNEEGSYLLSIIGMANTVGRIVLGFIADYPNINRLWIYNGCLTICGIATALSAFCRDFWSLAVYTAIFGFTIGAYVGLTSVILVDLLGLEKLTNAFGLLLLFQGIASLIGPPIAGELFDATKSYDPGFYVAGIAIAVSGLMLFSIPLLQKWEQKKKARRMSLDSI